MNAIVTLKEAVRSGLQPVLLGPLPNGASESYELVVESRRYRASKLARRETIPATIRELTDTQVVEIQLVENLLREGVHELDEASGYAALQKLNPNTYTVETIAFSAISFDPRPEVLVAGIGYPVIHTAPMREANVLSFERVGLVG